MRRQLAPPALALLLLAAASAPLLGQISGEERGRARKMLERTKEELEKEYYDTTFGGHDLDAAYQAALQRIEEADQLVQALAVIAQFTLDLDDSHTFFVPPLSRQIVDYGFEMGYVGDTCFIKTVDEGSSAHAAGLRPGDAVLQIGPYKPERESLWLIEYVYHLLYPQAQLSLTVRTPDGDHLTRPVEARIIELPLRVSDYQLEQILRVDREMEGEEEETHIYVETPAGVMLWQLPSFYTESRIIEKLIDKARKHRALILDLRDNPGGPINILRRMVGAFFEDEIVIGTELTRDGTEDLVAKPWGHGPFLGDLVVLVNAGSGSAAEIFARTMQLNDRGIVIGDRTAGEVMASRFETHEVGFTRQWRYALSVSVSDLALPDGSRLENEGVTPDELVIPTGADLRAGRDPALARALALVGLEVGPLTAGNMFDRESGHH